MEFVQVFTCAHMSCRKNFDTFTLLNLLVLYPVVPMTYSATPSACPAVQSSASYVAITSHFDSRYQPFPFCTVYEGGPACATCGLKVRSGQKTWLMVGLVPTCREAPSISNQSMFCHGPHEFVQLSDGGILALSCLLDWMACITFCPAMCIRRSDTVVDSFHMTLVSVQH